MCLGVPGKVIRWIDRAEPFALAEVEFGGVCREVGMDCVTDAVEGDYVIVHAGLAISRIDADEAQRTLAMLAELGELNDAIPPPEEPR
jgi:hydrogenase expression/formation protein HypC